METWLFAGNTFESNTRGSFRKMYSLSKDHYGKLKALRTDPDLNLLYLEFEQPYLYNSGLYFQWIAKESRYQGTTDELVELLKELGSTKMRYFDSTIQTVFDSETPAYKKIMSNGREPFQHGSIEDKISALEAFNISVNAEPAFTRTFKTAVSTFCRAVTDKRDEQQGLEVEVAELSSQLELSRVALSETFISVLGGLYRKYKSNLVEIENFYDLELIRNHSAGEKEIEPSAILILNPGATIESGITFRPATLLRIENTGASAISVYVSTTAGAPNPTGSVVLNPGESIEKPASELGEPNGTFLNVSNTHPRLSGEVTVFML